jgi:hypothetical protein
MRVFLRRWAAAAGDEEPSLRAARERERHTADGDQTLIALTFNEMRRLFARFIANSVHTIDHWLHRSTWRRRHLARAKTSHYRRRGHAIHQPAST